MKVEEKTKGKVWMHRVGEGEGDGGGDGNGKHSLTCCAAGDVVICRMGVVDYGRCCLVQKQIWEGVRNGTVPEHLLLVQHHHVFTAGARGINGGLLVGADKLQSLGVDLVQTDRGGELTYHGPGQMVAYPILNLASRARDVRKYVNNLEETVIRLCGELGIAGVGRRDSFPGVWVGGRGKLASLGIRISRWVTMHGVALNVMVDKAYFRMIVPCGIEGVEMVSLSELVPDSEDLSMERVEGLYARSFQDVFGGNLVPAPTSYVNGLLTKCIAG